jgi:UDPglucose 6-dehydrogenase
MTVHTAKSDYIHMCRHSGARRGYANLKYVYETAGQIAESVSNDCVVVVKSNVPIGTNDKLRSSLFRHKKPCNYPCGLKSEFLSQGTAIHDMLHGPRIVIGVESDYCESALRKVYAGFNSPIVVTDRRSAEMIKYLQTISSH